MKVLEEVANVDSLKCGGKGELAFVSQNMVLT